MKIKKIIEPIMFSLFQFFEKKIKEALSFMLCFDSSACLSA